MKRCLSILTAVMLICSVLVFTGCSNSGSTSSSAEPTKVEGSTWVVSGGSQGSTQVKKEDIETLLGGEVSYAFEAGGVVKATIAGNAVEGTWKQDGATVTLSIGGQDTAATLNGDKMVIEQGDVKLELSKK